MSKILVKGDIPGGLDELGLQRLARLALAVGVSSPLNSILTQIQEFTETANVSLEDFADDKFHNIDFLAELVSRDLVSLIQDGIELEEQINHLFTAFDLHYEVTGDG